MSSPARAIQVFSFNHIMSSQPEEHPQVSEAEQKQLDLEAAVKEKQEQDGELGAVFINHQT